MFAGETEHTDEGREFPVDGAIRQPRRSPLLHLLTRQCAVNVHDATFHKEPRQWFQVHIGLFQVAIP